MKEDNQSWPAWYYGPNGKSDVFASAAEVPAGWKDHPSQVKGDEKAPAAPALGTVPAPSPTPPAAADNGSTLELDADGHPFDPALHAATKSKTTAGLWRMKVGVSRPAPKPALDL